MKRIYQIELEDQVYSRFKADVEWQGGRVAQALGYLMEEYLKGEISIPASGSCGQTPYADRFLAKQAKIG